MRHVHVPNGRQESLEKRLADLAARQHGVLTRAQIVGHGATKGLIQHRVRTGSWQRASPGVFRVCAVPATWRQTLLIACFTWGAGAVVSHRAAAAMWRFLGFDLEVIEITVPSKRKRQHGPGTVHRGRLEPRDVTVVDALPVTTPTRTFFDIAAVSPRDSVEEALDDALRREIVSIDRLRRRLATVARSGRPGVALMRSLLDAREPTKPVPQSVMETRLLRLLKRRRLPEPQLQYPVRDGDRLVALVDFAWPGARLAVETDGFRWHSGRTTFERDRARRNKLTLLGWRVIHVTWAELQGRPDAVADSLGAALRP